MKCLIIVLVHFQTVQIISMQCFILFWFASGILLNVVKKKISLGNKHVLPRPPILRLPCCEINVFNQIFPDFVLELVQYQTIFEFLTLLSKIFSFSTTLLDITILTPFICWCIEKGDNSSSSWNLPSYQRLNQDNCNYCVRCELR